MDKTIYGHINCPTCGYTNGMRITADKNGDPFGYCEANCNQQLRVGGDARRVNRFLENYPAIAVSMRGTPGTGTGENEPPAPVSDPAPAPVPAKKPAFSMSEL